MPRLVKRKKRPRFVLDSDNPVGNRPKRYRRIISRYVDSSSEDEEMSSSSSDGDYYQEGEYKNVSYHEVNTNANEAEDQELSGSSLDDKTHLHDNEKSISSVDEDQQKEFQNINEYETSSVQSCDEKSEENVICSITQEENKEQVYIPVKSTDENNMKVTVEDYDESKNVLSESGANEIDNADVELLLSVFDPDRRSKIFYKGDYLNVCKVREECSNTKSSPNNAKLSGEPTSSGNSEMDSISLSPCSSQSTLVDVHFPNSVEANDDLVSESD